MIKIAHKNRYESSRLKRYNQKVSINNIEKFISEENNNYGIVIETNYNEAEILYEGKLLRTKLDKSFNTICNKTIYTGDKVILNKKDFSIEKIVRRKNMLCREKHDGSKINDFGITKVVATNIDLAVIVVSAHEPPLHPKFIDRYFILLKSNNIPFVIVMNKCDLKTQEERILNIYKDLDITVIETSTNLNIGISELKNILKGKQSILVGHSGVGKSSLVNAIMQSNNIKVGSVGEKTGKGCHTTTTSKYYKWNDNSAIIDTPGIRSLDISNFNLDDIQNYFPEFIKLKDKCKYNNCLHYEESINDCSIKRGVRDKTISEERYESYAKIISELMKKGK